MDTIVDGPKPIPFTLYHPGSTIEDITTSSQLSLSAVIFILKEDMLDYNLNTPEKITDLIQDEDDRPEYISRPG